MTREFIPVEESFTQWKKDPRYVASYEALENEFALASAMIKARWRRGCDAPQSPCPRTQGCCSVTAGCVAILGIGYAC
jgi:hypothetical protein